MTCPTTGGQKRREQTPLMEEAQLVTDAVLLMITVPQVIMTSVNDERWTQIITVLLSRWIWLPNNQYCSNNQHIPTVPIKWTWGRKEIITVLPNKGWSWLCITLIKDIQFTNLCNSFLLTHTFTHQWDIGRLKLYLIAAQWRAQAFCIWISFSDNDDDTGLNRVCRHTHTRTRI